MDWKKAFKSHLPLLAVGVWVVVGLACNALLPSDTPTDTIVTPPPEVGAPPEAPPAASEPSQTKDEEPPASSPETLLQSITPQELAALDPIGPENAGGLVPLLSFEPGEVIDFSWHPSGGFVAFGTFGHPYVSV